MSKSLDEYFICEIEKIGKQRFGLYRCGNCGESFKSNMRTLRNPYCDTCRKKFPNLTMTKVKLAGRLNSHCRANCKKRGHEYPFWHNSKSLLLWLESNDNFEELYKSWVDSGYEKDLTPSIDRLDNSKTYTEDNIELVTWSENNNRGREYQRNTSKHGAVSVYYKTGEYIDTFPTIKTAERALEVNNLHKTLSGERNHANGIIAVKEELELNVFDRVRRWGRTRGIVPNGNPLSQISKLSEEFAELMSAYSGNNIDEIENAIGDMVVVLTLLADILDFKLEDIANECQEEIGFRTGYLREDGVFVKDES